jgi:ubiquitin carboxyl-terminal hydrolase 48
MKKSERLFWTGIVKRLETQQSASLELPELMKEYCDTGFGDHAWCSKQKCLENPNCLVHLIPKSDTVEEIEQGLRSGPAGIKNLGATCYLNSFLQIWFRNIRFRMSIYRYQPGSSDMQRDIAGMLQYVFAELEYTKKKFIDVSGLIKMLDVPPVVQQDALEFSKLLLCLLESLLENSLDLKRQLFGQYQGEFEYVTTCQSCMISKSRFSTFDELRLYLTDQHSIEDGIRSLLQIENLVGENQYSCETCSSKQNAQRRTKLSILPPTINIVLNRFKFDNKTQTKQKLNTLIDFPLILDMAPFLVSSKKAKLYRLTAALLHSGVSANSGHYVSRVWDAKEQSWLDCDDELVQAISAPNFQFDDASEKVKPKQGRFVSSSAYLLVYQRESEKETETCSAPLHLIEHITKQNADYEVMMESQIVAQKEYQAKRKIREESLERLYTTWTDYSEGFFFISSKDLERSLLPLIPPVEEQVISSQELLCNHNKLSPSLLHVSKKISVKAIDILKTLGVRLDPILDSPCIDCFASLMQNRIQEIQHYMDVEEMRNAKKKTEYWISRAWFQEWKKKIPQFGDSIPRPDIPKYKADVVCEHGSLSIDETKRCGIPASVYKLIQKRFPRFQSLKFTKGICEQCAQALQICTTIPEDELNRISIQSTELKRLLTGRLLNTSADLTGYLVPMEFVLNWRKYIKSPTTVVKPVLIDLSSFWCSHQQLTYDLKVEKDAYFVVTTEEWAVLGMFYQVQGKEIPIETKDSWWTSSVPLCKDCRHLRRSNYTQGSIKVVKKTSDNSFSTGIRSSKRQKTTKTQPPITLSITPSSSIRDIMEDIQLKYEVPPLYQKIFFEGKELEARDNVSEIGILPGDTLEVELFDCEAEFEAYDDPQLEIGFSGTLLHGNSAQIIDLDSWACPICTFLNPSGIGMCEMCGFNVQ